MDKIRPEDLSAIRKTCKLDTGHEAHVMDDGYVLINSVERGLETVLSPQQACALRDLLNEQRDILYRGSGQEPIAKNTQHIWGHNIFYPHFPR